MPLLLRIKNDCLAFQSRLMRREENKALYHARRGDGDAETFRELIHNARTDRLRKQARSSHLAYGFLKGIPYPIMEQSCHERPDFPDIEAIALRYSSFDPRITKQQFAQWEDEARDWLRANPPMSIVPKPKPQPKARPAMISVRLIGPFPVRPLPDLGRPINMQDALGSAIIEALLKGGSHA
jgi:hypothetical protein